jgi:type II secretory pathway pseudopilin PulG
MSKTLSKIKSTLIISDTKSFTLVELLIVVGLIAVLSVAIILAINPAELLKQARDSQRLSDLTNLSKAISLYEADTGGQGFMGTSSVVYVSIPDTTSTCANLGLPQLPPSWSYRCVSSSTLQNIDGTGWIPINFNNLSFGKTLPKLPIDPINTTSSGNYYTYVSGGSFKLSSRLESQKYTLAYVAQDGGSNPALYETGTNLSLAPFIGGLVGYWSFDEASGTTAYDKSGFGNNGTLYSSTTICSAPPTSGCPQWTTGKVGSALSFDGVDDYIQTSYLQSGVTAYTIELWVKTADTGNQKIFIQNRGSGGKSLTLGIGQTGGLRGGPGKVGFEVDSDNLDIGISSVQNINDNNWHHVVGVWSAPSGTSVSPSQFKIYIDGVEVPITTGVVGSATSPLTGSGGAKIARHDSWNTNFNGIIDEIRIYNRALSDAEIKAIYEATK